MADARIAIGAAAAALAMLLLVAASPAPALAQDMQMPGAMQAPGAASGSSSGSWPGSMMSGQGANTIDLPELPTITMTAVPGYGPMPLTVGFFVNTVDPEGKGFVSYVWNFGDGQVSMDPPLTFFHTYTTAGSYVATVNATTADGRTAVGYVGITVRPSIVN